MSLATPLLWIHIFCGGISLIVGLLVLVLKKGDKQHKKIGQFYFWAMLIAALSALMLSCIRPNYFLFIISIFTAYMLISGFRYLCFKKKYAIKKADWILSLTMLIFGIAFLGLGLHRLLQLNFFGLVFIIFGGVSMLFVYQDYQNFKGLSNTANFWLIMHIQRMVGSYIASVTAFLVVNNHYLPPVIAWLLPTLILVPLLIKWSRKNELKK